LVDGKPAGEVTSGTFSPSLNIGLGMGFVDSAAFPKDSKVALSIRIHDKDVAAEAASPPFYKKG
jgi:aminomethyltransferase